MNELQTKIANKESLTLRTTIDNELQNNKLSNTYKKTESKKSQFLLEMENVKFLSSKKKMHTSSLTHATPLVQYYSAVLKENQNNWQIEYYCLNPFSERMERVRCKVNKLRRKLGSDTIARREIRKICFNINTRLENGWTPFLDQSSFNSISIEKSIDNFLAYKKNELRFESNHSYTSQLLMFKEWLRTRSYLSMLPCDFTKTHAIEYLDYVLIEKKVSNRTYNNYRCFLRIFFYWMIDRGYCAVNPFSKIKPKRNEKKERKIIPIEERKKIVQYMKENNYSFFIFTLLEYACLMRPIEILRSRFEDYNLDKQIIKLTGDETKNGDYGKIIIPNNTIDEIRRYFASLDVNKYDKRDYVFSNKLKPGTVQKTTRYTGGIWAEIRRKLNLPKEFKLYSLRDSSITELLINNIPAITVQKHARHSSLEMTQIYADHITPQMIEDIRENSPNFY